MKRAGIVVVTAFAAAIGYRVLRRVGRRSGGTEVDLYHALPGDDLVEQPDLIADRITLIDASPREVWPWLVQLGKQRGGWYFPAVVERFLPQAARGAWQIIPRFQSLAVGDIVPDYGPGNGVFKVMVLEPPHALVQYTIRQPSAGWTWPEVTDPLPLDVLTLSWAMVLSEVALGRTRLHVRLRANYPGWRSPLKMMLAETVDYVTTELMFRGLKERLRGENNLQSPL